MRKTENLINLLGPIVYRLQTFFNIRPRGMCLITGCPRSGTSAMLYWLKTHKQVAAFYESRILISAHRFLNETEKFKELQKNRNPLSKMMRKVVYAYHDREKYLWRKILVEKEPLEPMAFPGEQYEKFLENVLSIFPEIKIIFMVRDPVAVVWSMMNRKWGDSLTQNTQRKYSIGRCVRIWKANLDLIKKYSSNKNINICVFEKLIAESNAESSRIFDFLSISHSEPFRSKPTKTTDFSRADLEFILQETKSQRELISSLS